MLLWFTYSTTKMFAKKIRKQKMQVAMMCLDVVLLWTKKVPISSSSSSSIRIKPAKIASWTTLPLLFSLSHNVLRTSLWTRNSFTILVRQQVKYIKAAFRATCRKRKVKKRKKNEVHAFASYLIHVRVRPWTHEKCETIRMISIIRGLFSSQDHHHHLLTGLKCGYFLRCFIFMLNIYTKMLSYHLYIYLHEDYRYVCASIHCIAHGWGSPSPLIVCFLSCRRSYRVHLWFVKYLVMCPGVCFFLVFF